MTEPLVWDTMLADLAALHRRYTQTEPTVEVDDSLERATSSAASVLASLIQALHAEQSGRSEDDGEKLIQKAIFELDTLRSNLGA
ncbi:MAG: hypothetical protein ACRDRP_09605 [Pseudonocardiaceae bacterium]